MSDFNRGYARPTPVGAADMSVDAGLRSFMLGVYNKMALGLVVSAALAYLTSQYPPVRDLMFNVVGNRIAYTPIGMVVAFAPLAVILFSAFVMKNATPRSSGIVYWLIVSLMGAGLGVLGLVYTGTSIATTFLITASAFGVLSLLGYTTKRDLTGMGSFLIMGLWGVIIASVVNIFLQSSMMAFIVSLVGVAIFAGLTAYDTQKLKMQYYQLGGDQAALGVATNYGALNLYLDFVNLFVLLLRLTGARR
ncbi:Bax inhibitor-1/YccA family protein [Phenylobacterium sp.]|uniref:Bax inhibitor-1/YccA family protein n=1 Tax=Phenylobacterium sp. TaxID=1871053 RepID=UPI0012010015|nr:Bax inhibitor-1/YccA family protein [Phenylobacterium sp.]THD57738.1 MAG: Bax inhibitor-1/YccA family protein [Phenylobacterium sp.]